MKTPSKLAVLFLFVSFYTIAQKPPIKLGEVSKADVEMKEYALNPDADAVILCDYGYHSFQYNMSEGQWEHSLKRICRIKIFNDDGFDWAEESISLYDNNNVEESISVIKGYTYNIENGKLTKTKLSKSNVFKENSSKNYTTVRFSMPNVKEGSVVEFSYSITSNSLAILDPWYFQYSIPVKWSEYVVSIPDYFNYIKDASGFERYHKYETNTRPRNISWTSSARGNTNVSSNRVDYTDNIFHWVAKDMPELKDESYVGNVNNYMQSIGFQLSSRQFFDKTYKNYLGTWEDITRQFLTEYENFGPNMRKRNFYKDITESILAEYPDPKNRAAAVYTFVSNHMKWNKYNGFIPKQNIKKAYEERAGSCPDINGLLVSMLRAVELDADPVIISTITNGLVHPVYPILDKYNYLIARVIVDGKTILLDATEKDVPIGLLPMRCLNQRGYAISKTNPGWVDIVPIKGAEKSVFCMLDLQETGAVSGSVNYKFDGYSSYNIRDKITRDGKEKYIENVKSNKTDWAIKSVELDIPEEIEKPLKEVIEVESLDIAEAMGNMIYLNPIVSGKIDENPFKQDERKLPIEFVVPVKNSYVISLTIPEGYVVDEVPESINIVTPDRTANLKYIVQKTGNRLQVVHSWQIKQSFYGPEKFMDLKEFYAMLVSKQNEQIVLKKIEAN